MRRQREDKMRNHAGISVAVVSILTLCCSAAFAKPTSKVPALVIDEIPTTAAYSWQMAGSASVNCSGSTCLSYFTPPSSGTQRVQGAVLKLKLFSDSSIVIVQCVSQVRMGVSFLLAMASENPNSAPVVYRDCRAPVANSPVEVEFKGSTAKVYMQIPQANGSVKASSETYFIKGVLRPVSTPSIQGPQGQPNGTSGSIAMVDAKAIAPTQFSAKQKMDVTVIENVPTAASYEWQVPGHSSVSCSGSSCTGYFMPESSGISQVHGAVLKLLLPDGRIIVAGCNYNKGNIAFGIVGALTGDAHLNDPTSCAVPQVNDVIQVEPNGSVAKLSWRLPSIDGKGSKVSQNYAIRGVLQPEAPPVRDDSASNAYFANNAGAKPAPMSDKTSLLASANLPPSQQSTAKLDTPFKGAESPVQVATVTNDVARPDAGSTAAEPTPIVFPVDGTARPSVQAAPVVANNATQRAGCTGQIKLGMAEADVFRCKGTPDRQSNEQAVYSDGTHVYFDPNTHVVNNVMRIQDH